MFTSFFKIDCIKMFVKIYTFLILMEILNSINLCQHFSQNNLAIPSFYTTFYIITSNHTFAVSIKFLFFYYNMGIIVTL